MKQAKIKSRDLNNYVNVYNKLIIGYKICRSSIQHILILFPKVINKIDKIHICIMHFYHPKSNRFKLSYFNNNRQIISKKLKRYYILQHKSNKKNKNMDRKQLFNLIIQTISN